MSTRQLVNLKNINIMGNPKAFLNKPRQEAGYRPVHERVADNSELEHTHNTSERK